MDEGAVVIDSVIMPGAHIHSGAVVRRTIVAENAEICGGTVVGEETGNIAVIGIGVTVPEGTTIAAGQQYEG